MKAFAYLRVSTDEQAEHDGFDRQLAAIQKHAASAGVEIAMIFRDDISGAKAVTHRPAFIEAVEALESNGVKTLYIEKLDRLARDLMVQESIIKDFQRRGFTIVSTCEPDLCSTDPSRKMMRQIIGVFAEYERDMIRMRTKAARDRIRARGERCEGQKPYGVDSAEVAAIERMRALRASGQSFDTIASGLNDMGLKTRHNAKWYGCTVSKILAANPL